MEFPPDTEPTAAWIARTQVRWSALALLFAVVFLTSFGCGIASVMNIGVSCVSGPAIPSAGHFVTVTWEPSTSAVTGYFIYSSAQSGGPYSKLNGAPICGNSYVDATVQAGHTYFYVVTAVDANGVESVFSNEASATVPTP